MLPDVTLETATPVLPRLILITELCKATATQHTSVWATAAP